MTSGKPLGHHWHCEYAVLLRIDGPSTSADMKEAESAASMGSGGFRACFRVDASLSMQVKI